ncbi:MAG: hypothetical protein RIR86_3038, partial [Acidobacteriota bacterium]
LTDEIERRAFEYIDRIGTMGGMLAAIEAGYVQREIERAAFDYQRGIETEEQIVVGVNRFEIDEDSTIPTLRIDPAIEAAQVARVREVRATRHAATTSATLARVGQAARDGENLMPHLLTAVEAMATVGEIADTLRDVFGEYREAG